MMKMSMEVLSSDGNTNETREFKYYENLEMQIVELLYKGDDLAMYVILPNEKYLTNDGDCNFVACQFSVDNILYWQS